MTSALIIEDNDFNRMLASCLLRAHGLEAAIAADGTQGMALIDSLRSDVVLCDLGLPELNGIQVAQAIRTTPRRAHLKLLALTAYSKPGDRDDALLAGFDDTMAKPSDPETYATTVQRFANDPCAGRIDE